jgi:hypothetical protein
MLADFSLFPDRFTDHKIKILHKHEKIQNAPARDRLSSRIYCL